MIIVLHDIDESELLEYAVQSHKVGILDQYIIKFFNFLVLKLDKSIINHFLKILGRNPAFLKEKTISKKFKIKQVYAKSGPFLCLIQMDIIDKNLLMNLQILIYWEKQYSGLCSWKAASKVENKNEIWNNKQDLSKDGELF